MTRNDESQGIDEYLQGGFSGAAGYFQKRNSFLPPMMHISSQRTTDITSSRNEGFSKDQFTDFSTGFKSKMAKIDPSNSEFESMQMKLSKNSEISPSVVGWNRIVTKRQIGYPKKISSRDSYIRSVRKLIVNKSRSKTVRGK